MALDALHLFMTKRFTPLRTTLRYPIYIYSYQVASLVGWAPHRVRRLWQKHGIAKTVNGYCVTTPAQLRDLWPEQWEAILDKLEEGTLDNMTITTTTPKE